MQWPQLPWTLLKGIVHVAMQIRGQSSQGNVSSPFLKEPVCVGKAHEASSAYYQEAIPHLRYPAWASARNDKAAQASKPRPPCATSRVVNCFGRTTITP